jgi:chorismate mutase
MSGAAATACRGIRGATTVEGDASEAVHRATLELLDALVSANGCQMADVAAVIFSVSDDLSGANPAAAARESGWEDVPLLVVREHAGENLVSRCVRVLLLWNTAKPQSEIRHRYLRGTRVLRPDLPVP